MGGRDNERTTSESDRKWTEIACIHSGNSIDRLGFFFSSSRLCSGRRVDGANSLYYIEPGPVQIAIDPADGSVIQVPTEIVWRPICGSETDDVLLSDFQNYVRERRARKGFPSDDGSRDKNNPDNVTINFITDGTVPQAARDALDEVELYFESVFTDPITVSIYIEFDPLMSGGVLGATGVYTAASPVTWSQVRSKLISGMDYDDFIQDYLPATTLPVRYNGGSATITNENRCYFAWANYGAIGYTITGASGETAFNANVGWDYDPSDGVSGYCFQSTAVHETGHALGFMTRAEEWYQPNSDLFAMDIFRFQGTNGSGDYNPDTYEEFETAPRLVDYNTPDDDHNSNIFYSDGTDVEYGMEDGNPNQASHLRQSEGGSMVPMSGPGETDYPDLYHTSDLDIFDAMGWDHTPPLIDSDEDGLYNFEDNCPFDYNSLQEDADSDDVGDLCDNCIDIPNTDQGDIDDDDIGDICDPDADGDGYLNEPDNCPFVYDPLQENSDADSVGDACDNCPDDDNGYQYDEDGDGYGDACDTDILYIQCCLDMPEAYYQVPFSYQFWAINGVQPHEWRKDLGQLPYGLTLSSDGLLSGTPGAKQTAVFRIIAEDQGDEADTQWITIIVDDAPPPPYVCGDANGSTEVDIDDVVYLIAYIFSGGPAPVPLESGDADCSGDIDIDDAVYLIGYIFSGGNAPCDPDGDDVPDC